MMPRRNIAPLLAVLVLMIHCGSSKPVEKEEMNLINDLMEHHDQIKHKNNRGLDSIAGMGLGHERSIPNPRQLDTLGENNLPPSRSVQYQTRSMDSLVGFGLGGDKRREWSPYRSPKVTRGFDTLSGFTLGDTKKRGFDTIDMPGFGEFSKKNFDAIDMPGFGEFSKRNFDTIDMPGFGDFMKRSTLDRIDKRSAQEFDQIEMPGFGDFSKRSVREIDQAAKNNQRGSQF